MRDPCGGGNVLYVECINICILVVIFVVSFLNYYQGENEKVQEVALYSLVQLCVNL